jgi:hypothetical protein
LIFKTHIENKRMWREWTSWNLAKVKWNYSNEFNHPCWIG